MTPQDFAMRTNTPPLQGRGRGWGLTANELAELNRRATHMRNNPTEPEKRLWRRLSNGQLGGFKFRRQHVIGWSIADFTCPYARLIVEVDGDTHDDPEKDARRDAKLMSFGYRVVHVTNEDVMRNVEGVLVLILQAVGQMSNPHPNPSPEGEGLEKAQKLLGISLEVSLIDLEGMTVNERLISHGLLDAYDEAMREGDLRKINAVLAKVGLRQDENGMNWSSHAPNQ
jgi:very-short-patch-repair endonuclease